MKFYPVNSAIGLPNVYPLYCNLYGEQDSPTFEKLGPENVDDHFRWIVQSCTLRLSTCLNSILFEWYLHK